MNYEKSLNELKLYLKIIKEIPNETVWNRYAQSQEILSSKSLEYKYGSKFNKMCRELIKETNKESRVNKI